MKSFLLTILCFLSLQICFSQSFTTKSHAYPTIKEIIGVITQDDQIAYIGSTESDKAAYLIQGKSIIDLPVSFSSSTIVFFDVKSGNYGHVNFDKIYKNNNDLNDKSIYEMTTANDGVSINKLTFNPSKKIIDRNVFYLSKDFEFTNAGNIETFKTLSWSVGNGICAFPAKSTFSNKPYLFTYDIIKKKVSKIDLSLISNQFTNGNPGYPGVFVGQIRGKSISSYWGVNSIFSSSTYTVVLLSIDNILLPLITDQKGTSTIKWDCIISKGREYQENNNVRFAGNTYYLPVSKGFANLYSDGIKLFNLNTNNSYTLTLYNSGFNKLWQTDISEFTVIKYIAESGEYIIIGGYTTEKGYLSSPNARIIVIDKKTKAKTYDKLVGGKNSLVNTITSNEQGEIFVSVGSTSIQQLEDRNVKIIRDSLDNTGKFQNDLFQ